MMDPDSSKIRLGLRENLGQFSLLVLINVFVGMMVGLERTVVPLIGEREFGLVSKTTIVSFIVSFGITNAICSRRVSRKQSAARKSLLRAGSSACRFRSSSSLPRTGTGSILPTCFLALIRRSAGR